MGIAVLFGQSGQLPFILPLIGFIMAGLGAWLILTPPNAGLPNRGWLAALFGPAIIIAFLQALPLGWHHPWLTDDLAALGQITVNASWSIDSGRSYDSAFWLMALAISTFCLAALFSGDRRTALAMGTVIVLTGYAIYALCVDLLSGRIHAYSHAMVVGDFAYHNHAGAAWATCLPVAIYGAFNRSRWFWLAALILLVAIIHSASRTAIILSLAISIPWFLWLSPKVHRISTAIGALVVVGIMFSLIGIGAAGNRFRELGDGQAETLNGRSLIWETAATVLTEASPFGCGAGGTPIAMQRAPGIDLTGIINHLHSEPLELFLDYGWAGCIAIIMGTLSAVFILWRSQSLKTTPLSGDHFTIAVSLGLLMLILHSCLDYIFRNPVINLIAVIWLACLVQRWITYQKERPQLWHSGLMIGLCLCLTALSIYSFLREKELSKLPLLTANTVEQPHAVTPEYAAAQAALQLDSPSRAHDWLHVAGHLAPSSPSAWRARILVAMAAHKIDDAFTASRRLIIWAPDWISGQDTIIQLLATHGHQQDQRTTTLVNALLRDDRAWRINELNLFASLIGHQAVVNSIQQHSSVRVRRAALPWVRQYTDLEQWRAIRHTIPLQHPLDPIQLPVFQIDGDERKIMVAIAKEKEGRRAQAERCLRAGYTLPLALDQALKDDGEIGELYRRLPTNFPFTKDDKLRQSLDGMLHIPWAKAWWTMLNDSQTIEHQEWSLLSAHSYPPFLEIAFHSINTQKDPALAARLASWLDAFSLPNWNDAGWGVSWSWLRVQPNTASIPLPDGWTGVFIDGKWLGWQRHSFNPVTFTTPGIHRITLATPP